MAILTEQEKFIFIVVYIVGEVWAFILRVAGMLVKLELHKW
jgi:hypothetical protein